MPKKRWWEMSYAPLLARVGLFGAIMTPIVFGTLYPERKQEAEAYENAPTCAAPETTAIQCRRMTDATYIASDCEHNLSGQNPDDYCELQLYVDAATKYIAVDRVRMESLRPGDTVRVEMFDAGPAAIEFDGQLIQRRGNPREAMHMLRVTVAVWMPIGLLSAVYLYRERRRERREATSSTSPT